MATQEIVFQKKREPVEVISDSFKFLQQEHKTILKLIRNYVLPFIIINAILQVYVQKQIFEKIDIRDTEALMANFGPVYINFLLASLFALFVQSLFIGTYYSFLEGYINERKNGIDLSDISHRLFSNSLQALKANVILFLLVTAGLFLCILPGIYFANTFSLLVMVYLFEKNKLGASLSRSYQLVNMKWWNTFMINVVGVALIYFSGLILSIPSMFTESGPDITSVQEAALAGSNISFKWIWTGITTLITSLLWLIPYTFIAFQYFNLREHAKTAIPDDIDGHL